MDYGAEYTERQRRILYRRLRRQYREAQKNLEKKLKDFLAWSAAREKLYEKKVEAGLLTQSWFDNWKQGQVFIGKRWDAKLDEVTGTLTEANQKALAMIRGEQYKVFAENSNYQSYMLEKDGQKHNTGISFDIYDETTVRRLIQEKPELLKRSTWKERKDKAWNQGIISNSIAQGIIQGESIPQIAERIARDTCDRNNTHMMLYARTAMTCAQNAGRIETMHRATDMGLHVLKEWIATLDSRTRDSHQHLDGQTQEVDKPFDSILGDIMYPGDPDAAPANVWNCRCTLGSVYVDYESDGNGKRRDNETGEEIEDMTYDEWKEWKEEQNQTEKPNEEEKIYGSAYGIVKKTNQYNDKEHEINTEIGKLDEEYQRLYHESFLKFGTPEYDEMNERMQEIQEKIDKLRGKAVDIQADRSRYLAENGEKDILKAFGKIEGKHNAAVDAKSVNFMTFDKMTQNNCGSCVLAFDARRRGINAEAILSYGTNNIQVESWWDGIKIRSATSYWGADAREEIRGIANQWGEGARGIVQVDWGILNGHYFAFEVVNGRCVFFDPQTGIMNADNLFDGAVPGSVKYARTDDKPLTKASLFGMKGKNE